MRLEPLYQRDREQAKQEGRQEGRQEGEQHLIIRLLNRRVGEINESLIERITELGISSSTQYPTKPSASTLLQRNWLKS